MVRFLVWQGNACRKVFFRISSACLANAWLLSASAAPAFPDSGDALIRQEQREQALRQRIELSPDVRLEEGRLPETQRLPVGESPCFVVNRIVLAGNLAERFQWALAASTGDDDSPIGRCLGADGVGLVMKRIQNAILERGFVTTRVLAPMQDLKTGVLELTLIPGRIRNIRLMPGSGERATVWSAFPMAEGDLLNLRDIEQALENLKRVPTAEADIQIAPSEEAAAGPGDSDLMVSWQQSFPLRINLAADNSGTRATGKNQGSVTVSGDNLLAMHDLFYLMLNRDLAGDEAVRGTHGGTVYYSVPFGYWLFSASHSTYSYHQSVAGASQTYLYSGDSSNNEMRLSRLVWRNAIGKTLLGVRVWERDSSNFIDDAEIQVQRRRMAGWEINASQRLFLKEATLDANLAYRRGTGAFRSLPAPEEAFGEGSSRPRLVTADAQLGLPFALLGQRFRYTLAWRAQWNETPLVPQDRFAIGGRYTVRGFDGENLLSAERGWLVRNDLGIALGASGQEAYCGVDIGQVGGASADTLVGRRLAGMVVGWRGGYHGLGYDFFIGNPAGISCDGCGIINASRFALTTGMPIINGNGGLDGYRVQQGAVQIQGAGFDGSRADAVDVIARAVQINAGLWANQLNVTTGANQVGADNGTVTPVAGSGPAPVFALDVARLGGMYAGKIHLVGSEAGVGVRNAGSIGASAGELVLNVDGPCSSPCRSSAMPIRSMPATAFSSVPPPTASTITSARPSDFRCPPSSA